MDNYIVTFKNNGGHDLYVSGKTSRMMGKVYEDFTSEKIRAKFYMSEKVANNKANKLTDSNLYSGSFSVEKLTTEVHIR